MNDDPRYASGSSLDQTAKEEVVSKIEKDLGEMTDDLFLGLKRLTLPQLAELLRLIRVAKNP